MNDAPRRVFGRRESVYPLRYVCLAVLHMCPESSAQSLRALYAALHIYQLTVAVEKQEGYATLRGIAAGESASFGGADVGNPYQQLIVGELVIDAIHIGAQLATQRACCVVDLYDRRYTGPDEGKVANVVFALVIRVQSPAADGDDERNDRTDADKALPPSALCTKGLFRALLFKGLRRPGV